MADELPEGVQVGAYPYKVTADDELRDDGHRGDTMTERLRIRIDGSMPLPLQRVTLLHELLHACWDYAGLGGEEADEERVVKALAPILVDVMERNPRTLAFVFSQPEPEKPEPGTTPIVDQHTFNVTSDMLPLAIVSPDGREMQFQAGDLVTTIVRRSAPAEPVSDR